MMGMLLCLALPLLGAVTSKLSRLSASDLTMILFPMFCVPGAVTNMLAVCFAKRDWKGVNEVLSDSLSIALVMGTLLGAALYSSAPWMLARIAGPASAEVVGPALSYVRLRCLGSLPTAQRGFRVLKIDGFILFEA